MVGSVGGAALTAAPQAAASTTPMKDRAYLLHNATLLSRLPVSGSTLPAVSPAVGRYLCNGLEPVSQVRGRPADYVFVAAGVLAVIALLLWALLG